MNTAMMNAAEQDAEIEALLIETIDRLSEDQADRTLREAAEQGNWPDSLWNAISELGLPRCMLPEEQSGSGLGLASAMRALKRTAFHGLPLPIAESMIASRLLQAAGLPMPEGIIAAGLAGEDGTMARVPWGAQANHLVAIEGRGANARVTLYQGTARIIRAEINLAGEPRVTLSPDSMSRVDSRELAHADELLMRYGALARSAQMAGAMERSLQLALQYASERVQFGRPISKFQAVQHMLAVQASHAAACSAALDGALDVTGEHPTSLCVAIAKARISEAAGLGADIAHQVHGAMGFTREHVLHNLTRRLYAWRDEYGNEVHWQRQIGHEVAAKGADALWPMLSAL